MKIDMVYVGVIILIIAVVGYLFLVQTGVSGLSPQQAAERVRQIYALQYETTPEIVSVNETSGLYGVVLQINITGTPTLQQVFITKDGQLIADRLIVAGNYERFLGIQKDFVNCLSGKGVRVFGSVNDTATLQQLSVLGNYGYKLFISCDPPNTQACINYGVKRIPTTVINNTGYDAAVYNLQFYSNLTGCTLPA